jgi:hypothetical protein
VSLRNVATAIAAGRVVLGTVLLVAPERIGRSWIGPAGTERSVEVMARAVGVRDVAIGVGGAVALMSGSDSARAWMLAAAAADLGDLVATLLARDVLPAQGVAGVGALAGGSAVLCAATAATLD